jgi:hypothetical protein
MRKFALVFALFLGGCSEGGAEVAPNEWQSVAVARQQGLQTDRIAVPGGWLYREVFHSHGGSVALCFVADAAAVASRG